MPGVHDLLVDGRHACSTSTPNALDAVLRHLSALGVRALTATPPTLEELFLRHYGDELAGEGEAQPAPAAR